MIHNHFDSTQSQNSLSNVIPSLFIQIIRQIYIFEKILNCQLTVLNDTKYSFEIFLSFGIHMDLLFGLSHCKSSKIGSSIVSDSSSTKMNHNYD